MGQQMHFDELVIRVQIQEYRSTAIYHWNIMNYVQIVKYMFKE